jgi:hypothetical protein
MWVGAALRCIRASQPLGVRWILTARLVRSINYGTAALTSDKQILKPSIEDEWLSKLNRRTFMQLSSGAVTSSALELAESRKAMAQTAAPKWTSKDCHSRRQAGAEPSTAG